MMKAAAESRICPACGARNKPSWEYCARCGESLSEAAAAPRAAAAKPTPPAAAFEVAPASRPAVWPLLVALVALAAGVVLWRSGWRPTADRPSQQAFTFPTLPPQTTLAVRTVRPGADAFAEARRRLAAGDVAGAIPLFEQAIGADLQNPEYHYGYGQALKKAGRLPDGLAQFREAARLSPATHGALLAKQLVEAGRNDEAIQAYDAAFTADPDNAEVPQELGRLLYEAKQYDRAAKVLARAVEKRPFDAELRLNLGWALEQSGDPTQADQVYRKLLSEDPQRAGARIRLAEVMFKQGDKDGAIATYREGIGLTPGAPTLHRAYGLLLERTDRLKDAAAEYREYVRLDPSASDAAGLTARAQLLERRAASAAGSAP